jgi:hypothetical protein
MKPKVRILNSEGQPIVLNAMEKRIAGVNQRIVNALGFDIDITTLTTVMKKITEQKFYKVPFADYLPVRVGEGAWSSSLETYRSFQLGDDFATGIINTASNDTRLASADAGVDSINVKVKNWAKTTSYTIFDIEQASKSGNWDLIAAKERARKTNWDLGVQKIAFLGLEGDASVLGLLNQAGIENDTTLISKFISDMDQAELNTFISSLLSVYRENCEYTAMPTHFVIPEKDYLGLAAPSSPDFPIKSKLAVLLETLVTMTQNPDFKILPSAYANNFANNEGNYRYALYNYDEYSLRMDIPVDYTNTIANSINNFQFTSTGYGQITGAMAYRPREMIYFTFDATP